MVDADAVGLLGIARGGPIEVGQGRPVVAHAEAEIVVVEFGGGLADDAGGLDAGRLVEGAETCGVMVVEGSGLHAVMVSVMSVGKIIFLSLLDDRAVGAPDEDALVVGAVVLAGPGKVKGER